MIPNTLINLIKVFSIVVFISLLNSTLPIIIPLQQGIAGKIPTAWIPLVLHHFPQFTDDIPKSFRSDIPTFYGLNHVKSHVKSSSFRAFFRTCCGANLAREKRFRVTLLAQVKWLTSVVSGPFC